MPVLAVDVRDSQLGAESHLKLRDDVGLPNFRETEGSRQMLVQVYLLYAALSVWNSLPCQVRPSDTLMPFKSSWKSYLSKLS